MKTKRFAAVFAAAAAGALLFSACTTPEVAGPGTAATPTPGEDGATPTAPAGNEQAVFVGWNEPFRSTNNLTPMGNSTTNANVIYMTTSTFGFFNQNLEWERNTDFGTIEVVNEDPLTVKYTVNEGVMWSDGTPVDAADMILFWGAQNACFDSVRDDEFLKETGVDCIAAGFNPASTGEVQEDEDGNPIVADNEVYFNSSSVGMTSVSQFPEIGDNGRSVTFIYDEPRADWEMQMSGPSPVAAHVVARRALGIEDPAAAKTALIDAFQNHDNAALAPLSKVWLNDFNFTSLPSDPELYLSYGPMIISEFQEGQYITLVRNPDFTWGRIPHVDTITIRYSEDPLASVTALQNGEVDLIQPQSSVDVLATLEGINGVSFESVPEGTYEHIDLTFDNMGPFDPRTYGVDDAGNATPEGEAKALAVRTAFLLTVPRQQILDVLIRPLQEDAKIRNSFTFVPGSPGYDEVVAASGIVEKYGEGSNIEAAKALLADAGVETPIDVRMLYGASNVRRANQFELIRAQAEQAGFNMIDDGDDRWGTRLGDGTYDVSLFGWQSTSTALLNAEANFITGGMNNFGGYSNPEVDRLWQEARGALDHDNQVRLAGEIERHLVDDAFGLTIFQFPGVTAWRDNLQGVSTIPLAPTIFWNFWDWQIVPGSGQ